jgi:transcriptional regulator with XRE-family HTH domain
MKQSEIAKLLNISEPMVSLVLKGERRLSVENAKAAAEIFGVDWTVFFDGDVETIRRILTKRPVKLSV